MGDEGSKQANERTNDRRRLRKSPMPRKSPKNLALLELPSANSIRNLSFYLSRSISCLSVIYYNTSCARTMSVSWHLVAIE